MSISILILAAGSASRMGKTKQLLPFQDSTLLGHAINQALKAKVQDVYCVLGANAEAIKNKLKTTQAIFIDNFNWNLGLSSSIVSGIYYINSLKNAPDAVLIMLSDQPFVDTNYINSLIETYCEHSQCIIASDYGNKKGVPAIFPKEAFDYLLNIKGDKGAKKLLNSGVFDVISIKPKDENTLKDIDTPSEYNSLLNN